MVFWGVEEGLVKGQMVWAAESSCRKEDVMRRLLRRLVQKDLETAFLSCFSACLSLLTGFLQTLRDKVPQINSSGGVLG